MAVKKSNTVNLPTQSEEELAEKLRECEQNHTMQSSVTEFNVDFNSLSIISVDNHNNL